jgi:hypothetical protein
MVVMNGSISLTGCVLVVVLLRFVTSHFLVKMSVPSSECRSAVDGRCFQGNNFTEIYWGIFYSLIPSFVIRGHIQTASLHVPLMHAVGL